MKKFKLWIFVCFLDWRRNVFISIRFSSVYTQYPYLMGSHFDFAFAGVCALERRLSILARTIDCIHCVAMRLWPMKITKILLAAINHNEIMETDECGAMQYRVHSAYGVMYIYSENEKINDDTQKRDQFHSHTVATSNGLNLVFSLFLESPLISSQCSVCSVYSRRLYGPSPSPQFPS